MGHTRLGEIPKTRKWNEVVAEITGSVPGRPTAGALNIRAIAAQTLDAAQDGLKKAANDPGVRYTFFLLTQVALASKTENWEIALDKHGIHLSDNSTLFDFTSEIQDAIDRYNRQSGVGPTDVSEIAQQAAGEAITTLTASRTPSLFAGETGDIRNSIRSLSTKKGFGELGQKFFGRFAARFLNFYLSRVTARALGGPRFHDLADVARFNEAIRTHCDQSARIVRDFCGDWYSKTEYEQGIDLKNTSRFLAIALKKLRTEMQHQGADL